MPPSSSAAGVLVDPEHQPRQASGFDGGRTVYGPASPIAFECFTLEEDHLAGLTHTDRVGTAQDRAVCGVEVHVDAREVLANDLSVWDPFRARSGVGAQQPNRDVVGVVLPTGVGSDDRELRVKVSPLEDGSKRSREGGDVGREKLTSEWIADWLDEMPRGGLPNIDRSRACERFSEGHGLESAGEGGAQRTFYAEDADVRAQDLRERRSRLDAGWSGEHSVG